MKKDQQFSLVSCIPALFTSLRIPPMMFSSSSPKRGRREGEGGGGGRGRRHEPASIMQLSGCLVPRSMYTFHLLPHVCDAESVQKIRNGGNCL